MAKRPVIEVTVKEIFTYQWMCPICGEENDVRVSIPKVFLPCPICNVTFRRDHVSVKKWRLLTEQEDKENSIDPEIQLEWPVKKAAV